MSSLNAMNIFKLKSLAYKNCTELGYFKLVHKVVLNGTSVFHNVKYLFSSLVFEERFVVGFFGVFLSLGF